MKDQLNYYDYYEKIMKMNLHKSIVTTTEYRNFSKVYPCIAESIRLKREIERLTCKLESEKERSAKSIIKMEINTTKNELKKNNLFKRLHSESKQEAKFNRRLKLNTTKTHFSSMIKKKYNFFRHAITNLRKQLRKSMHRYLPPTVFNLRELDVSERGLVLKEWMQQNCKKNR